MVGNSLKEIQTLEVPVMAKMAEEGFLFMAKKKLPPWIVTGGFFFERYSR